jgi:hypothetical protein
MTIATITRIPTSVDHRWAQNAANCAFARAELAANECGRIWRGGTLGWLGVRHPEEGASQSQFNRYSNETKTGLSLQMMKRWYFVAP